MIVGSESLGKRRTVPERALEPEQAVDLAFDVFALVRERDRLHEERRRLTREVDRLSEENDDLRKSAEIWIRLYERQLARANDAIDRLS